MTFHQPINPTEGRHYVGWHIMGLSHRDMRDLIDADPGWRFPRRDGDTIVKYLKRRGYEPHPAQRGPKVDGRETHCYEHSEPVERKGKNNECPVCKTATARRRRERVRAGLDERIEVLRALGGEAAEVADWIEQNVRVA